MSGLGGLNKSPDGVVIGLVKLQLPTVVTPDDLAAHMQDLVNGCYRLPWEDEVIHQDGTSCGFAAPTRTYQDPVPQTDSISTSVHGG